jgi:dipeptidyl aminopeptidase/acylaminoacyl peptidase
MAKKPTLFISYRRDPSEDLARLLYEHLEKRGFNVFYDFESLNDGRFDKAIEAKISKSDYFLIILAPGTLDSPWVRQEIATALQHEKTIIPLFTRDFDFPQESMGEIEDLRFYNGVRYHPDLSSAQNLSIILNRMGRNDRQISAITLIAVAVVIVGLLASIRLFSTLQSQATAVPTEATKLGSVTSSPTPVDIATALNTAMPVRQNAGIIGGGSGKLVFIRDGDLWIVMVNGTEPVKVLVSPAEEAVPVWSPDGKRIAFRSNRDGNSEIYVVDADGSNLKRLTQDNAVDTSPTWSPDGKYIAYRSLRDNNAEIKLIDMNNPGAAHKNLTNNPANDYSPKWSPDGKAIVFTSNRTGNYEIWKMKADGSGQQQVTSNRAANYTPSISPNGEKIAYSTDVSQKTGYDIYIINSDSSQQALLFGDGSFNESPDYSPDGKYILFASSLSRNGPKKIYIIDAQGSGRQFVVDGDQPSWQPEG